MDAVVEKENRVWFVGAGPGDPELLTVKAWRLLLEADLVVYAGSLVPPEVAAPSGSRAVLADSSSMTLEETHALMCQAWRQGKKVVRLHTGDPGLYGAVREQKMLLDAEGIPNGTIPGISAAFAAAAAAGVSLTVPERTQSLCITRLGGRTRIPDRQRLQEYAGHGGSLAVYLSSGDAENLAGELRAAGLPEEVPMVIGYRIGWPDQKVIKTSLAGFCTEMHRHGLKRQAVVLVLPGERDPAGAASKLYDQEFAHGFRKKRS